MKWYWIVLIISFVLYVLFRLLVWFFGNWRMTLNNVITQFIAISMEHPEEDFRYWFWLTIENRYPLVLSGPRRNLYERKENLIVFSTQIVFADDDTKARQLLRKETLPSLILFCLIVESHSLVSTQSKWISAYSQIEAEVVRQGFSKYC